MVNWIAAIAWFWCFIVTMIHGPSRFGAGAAMLLLVVHYIIFALRGL